MFLCVLGYFWYFWVLFGIVLYRYCTDIVSTLYQYISHSLGRRNSFVCHFETHATVALLGLFIFNPLKLSPLSLPLPFLNFYLTFTFSNISFSSSFIAFSVLPLIFSSSFSSSHSVFLVADTRLYTLPCRSVRLSVPPSHVFFNCERCLYYYPCPTVRDCLAVYPAFIICSSLAHLETSSCGRGSSWP